MQEYLDMWRNFANFTGRTTVRGYWMAFLFNFLAGLVLSVLIAIVPELAFLSSLYSLAAMVPGLALSVRRLRDAGKGWGWLFISLVPLVGSIILIVMLCKPSVPADNRAIPSPEY